MKNEDCIKCKYSHTEGFDKNGTGEIIWKCGLDDKRVDNIDGICTMYEESTISQLISNSNPCGQSDDYIPDFPDDVQAWIDRHPPKDTEPQGVKYDDGKPRLAEMIQDFDKAMIALCKVWEYGADKYTKSNWKFVDDGERRYTNALVRHLVAENDSMYDSESYLLHAAHIAFNAIARLQLILQDYEVIKNDD